MPYTSRFNRWLLFFSSVIQQKQRPTRLSCFGLLTHSFRKSTVSLFRGEYIFSLKDLQYQMFAGVVKERFKDLYWEEDLLGVLHCLVNYSPSTLWVGPQTLSSFMLNTHRKVAMAVVVFVQGSLQKLFTQTLSPLDKNPRIALAPGFSLEKGYNCENVHSLKMILMGICSILLLNWICISISRVKQTRKGWCLLEQSVTSWQKIFCT